jgi:hypothetical protein
MRIASWNVRETRKKTEGRPEGKEISLLIDSHFKNHGK